MQILQIEIQTEKEKEEERSDWVNLWKKMENINGLIVAKHTLQSVEELELSNYLSKKSVEKKTNIARSYKYELLLWLTGETNIEKALEKSKPKDGENSFLILFGDKKQKRIRKVIDEKLVFGMLKAKKLKLQLKKLQLNKKADPIRLEKISLSRI